MKLYPKAIKMTPSVVRRYLRDDVEHVAICSYATKALNPRRERGRMRFYAHPYIVNGGGIYPKEHADTFGEVNAPTEFWHRGKLIDTVTPWQIGECT